MGSLAEEVKRDNRIVAEWLLFCPERKAGYLKRRAEILYSSPPKITETGPATPGHTGDSTGNKAAKLAELDRTAQWIRLVEDLEANLPWKMYVILQLRREAKLRAGKIKGRPAWVQYVQHKYAEELAKHQHQRKDEVWVSSPTVFFGWWDKIVDYGVRMAAKRGLL